MPVPVPRPRSQTGSIQSDFCSGWKAGLGGRGARHWHLKTISPAYANGQAGIKVSVMGGKYLIDFNVHFFLYGGGWAFLLESSDLDGSQITDPFEILTKALTFYLLYPPPQAVTGGHR